jgi:cytochrome b561
VAVCVVTLGRLVWRQFARFPNWAADMPQAMRFAAQWSEYALYAFLPTQPILGLLHTNARGDRVNLFFPASWRRCAAGSARSEGNGGTREMRTDYKRCEFGNYA